MSRVRYTNKKTGWVSVYESESHYDPITKKSRPIRKYIGHEDPVSGEFIPSSGKAGRKKKTGIIPESKTCPEDGGKSHMTTGSYYTEYKRALEELRKLREENKILRSDTISLCNILETAVPDFEAVLQTIRRIKSRWG